MIAAGHEVIEVVTQPDRPKGRKQELTPSPGESGRAAPWHPGLSARAHPARRSRGTSARPRARSDGNRRLRPDHPADHHRYRAARHHQRARVAAAGTARRRAHPVVDRARLCATPASPPCGSTPASIPATSARTWETPDRSGRNRARTFGRDWPKPEPICWSGRWLRLSAGTVQPRPQDNARATFAPDFEKGRRADRLEHSGPARFTI